MLTKTRYIPKDSRPIEHPAGLGVAYLYGDGRPCVIAYGGKRTKADWHYSFRTQEAAQKKIDEWFASLTGHETLKAQFKAERNKPHSLKVGDIIYNSWGWEQTNIDFYQVVRVSEHCVWLRKLCHETEEKGFMQGPTRPILGQFAEDEITQHHASENEHGVHIHFKYGAGYRRGLGLVTDQPHPRRKLGALRRGKTTGIAIRHPSFKWRTCLRLRSFFLSI